MHVDGPTRMLKPPLYKRLASRAFAGEAEGVFRGMAVLAAGSAMAKVVGVVSMPILTRLYTPEDFGVMAVFTALISMLTPLLTLRFVLAIPLPRRDGTAMNVVALSFLLIFFFGLAMGLLFWAFAAPLMLLIGMQELAVWWWLIVLGCLGGAVYEVLSSWATRRRAYKVIARTSVTQQLWSSLVKLGLGAMFFGPGGLLLGQVIAKSGGSITLARSFWTEFKRSWQQVRFSRVMHVAARYASFPIYRVPSQFLLLFAQQFPLIGVAYLYDPAMAGGFSLAMTALTLPLGLVGTSMGTALYAEASNLGLSNRNLIYLMAKQVQIRLLIVSVGPAFILFMFGPQLFSFFFGPSWEQAGKFASILAVVTLFQFTSAPIIKLMNIFSNQSTFLIINIVRATAVAGLLYMTSRLAFDAETFLVFYAALMTIFYVFVSVLVMQKIKNEKVR